MDKQQKRRGGIVYSTNPDLKYDKIDDKIDTLIPKKQYLEIYNDRHKAGKTTVIIKKFVGKKKDLKEIGKMLKKQCGVGGSIKHGDIIIQGNIRDKIITILNSQGYNCKKIGG